MNVTVLTVGADPNWSRAIHGAASRIGAGVHAVRSGRAAMARLVGHGTDFTHVLLNPARDDGLLRTLLGLTSDEAGTAAELLLLGRARAAPPHARTIAGPNPATIHTALTTARVRAPAPIPTIAELRTALSDKLIRARYQPMVNMTDGRPAGVEALARLYRTGHGVLLPESFVPQIESAGLARNLTELIAGRSFADIASDTLAPFGFLLAVNFPLDVLLVADALRALEVLRKQVGLAASRILVELTESRAVANLPQLERAVLRLREAGYRVAIDDVSPAVANHEALLALPFTTMKLDRAIVARGATDPAAAAFVERTIASAKARGLVVIAEGIADRKTWNRMRRAGADLAQGFFIARPLPLQAVPAWMAAWRRAAARKDLHA